LTVPVFAPATLMPIAKLTGPPIVPL
jgi:hypothetical protein